MGNVLVLNMGMKSIRSIVFATDGEKLASAARPLESFLNGDMVEQNSTPQYANEQVAQLDAYIKNGGNFEDFYTQQSRTISYDNIDMEDESN